MKQQNLHYITMGSGSKLLLAFHGYGNTAELFRPFTSFLQEYTMISVDLPHHGQSDWPTIKKLEVKELLAFVNTLMQEYGVDKCSLMGYSMGGRVCLKIAEQMPAKIERVVLMAPDGLAFNPLYFFVTGTIIGKGLFKSFLTNPIRYMKWIELARKRKWLDESRYKFAMQYLQSEHGRSFLLKVWPCMSLIMPDFKTLKKLLNKHQIHVDIFMGKHDRVIPVSLAKNFQKGADTVQLHILDKGHRLFDADALPQITAVFRP